MEYAKRETEPLDRRHEKRTVSPPREAVPETPHHASQDRSPSYAKKSNPT